MGKTICALANRSAGGLIVFGIDETSYEPVGVGDPDQLQRDLGEAASNLEPPVRLALSAHVVGGWVLIVADVPEAEPQFRPCYVRTKGPHHGAYVRVGDGERQMTEYEVYLALACHTQPKEDVRPIGEASLEDLDFVSLDAFLARARARTPALARLAEDRVTFLRALNVVTRDDPTKPTLAGLLVFGR